MSATRMAKRHPKPPVENILTTRAEIIAFAHHISRDEAFCLAVVDTIATIEKREQQLAKEKALLAEMERRSKLPKWRRWLSKVAREF